MSNSEGGGSVGVTQNGRRTVSSTVSSAGALDELQEESGVVKESLKLPSLVQTLSNDSSVVKSYSEDPPVVQIEVCCGSDVLTCIAMYLHFSVIWMN